MESSRTVYYLYRYLPVVVGLFILSLASLDFLYPEFFQHDNGRAVIRDVTSYSIAGVIGLICVIAPLFYQHRLAVVRLTEDEVFIQQSGEPLVYDWQDVTQLTLYRRYRPTLYKLRVKGDSDYFLFSTGYSVITASGRSHKGFAEFFVIRVGDTDDAFGNRVNREEDYFILSDTSEMGAFIERKKREFNI